MHCIHDENGLCPACHDDYQADPAAWIEYGDHADGLDNWQRTKDEIAADAENNQSEPGPSNNWWGQH